MPVNISLSDGNITSTSLGKVWTLRLSIPNALNIGLTFTQFNLSPSAEMYIYNDAETILNYQIKKEHFTNSDKVSVSSMNGNAIIIYIIEANNFGSFQSTFTIGQVLAGYQSIEDVGEADDDNNTLRVHPTYCIPDVRCYPEHMASARAVARFVTDAGGCSCTLINNEQNNGRAYVISAFHCLDINKSHQLEQNELDLLKTATFQFQFWRTYCNSQINNTGIEFSGAVLRASNYNSDMILLELLNPPGIGDGVNYAGWNRQTSAPSNSGSYIIHHPEGRNMRHTQTRDVGSYLNANFWVASYSSGVVVGGSSGSALFNENNQIVGQLKGGWTNCMFSRLTDRYGKFYRSWDNGGLQQWLSPVQGLQSIWTLDLTNISFTGPNEISCTSPTGQYSTIPGLLDVTYTWTVSSGLQINSGQGTPNVTISALQGQDRTETITLTLASPTKGRIRTFTVSRNITVSGGAPNTTCTEVGGGTCFRQIFLCPSELNNWQYVYIPGTWGTTGTGFHIEAQGGAYFNGGATSMNITTNSFSVWAPSLGAYNSSSVTVSAMNGCGVSPYQPYVIAFIEKDPYQCGGYYYYSIAPNPAQSTMSVSLNKSITDAAHSNFDQVSIYDQLGNLKFTKKFGKVKTGSINVGNLTTGIYIVEISDGTYKERQQLMVQK